MQHPPDDIITAIRGQTMETMFPSPAFYFVCARLNLESVYSLELLKKAHAEVTPPLQSGRECWYLPLFGVYHPRKPDKIRVVFDSSASCEGVSLNDVLLTGPDLNNSLVGVPLRFIVKEDHRDFLRFLWFRNNDPTCNIVDYRM